MKDIKVSVPGLFLAFESKSIGEEGGVSLAEAFSELVAKFDINVVSLLTRFRKL